MKNLIILVFIALLATSCKNVSDKKIVVEQEIETYFDKGLHSKSIDGINVELAFWTKKYNADTIQYLYLIKMAAQNEQLFQATEDITYCINASNLYAKAAAATQFKSTGTLRALARNMITQHRFSEANLLITKAYLLGEKKIETEKMRFDIAMEIGQYDIADKSLQNLQSQNDFDYLIRCAKWLDHKGNLNTAISLMENAKALATTEKDTSQLIWLYTNLADFYGHNNNIAKSYDYYKTALKLNPYDAYALKGIAWIAYSNDHNYDLAEKIITKLNARIQKPEYQLLLAEIEETKNNTAASKVHTDAYFNMLKDKKYGEMYNKYSILNNPKSAQAIAEREVLSRPNPETYAYLAWTKYHNGQNNEALKIINDKVFEKTFEPESLFIVATIFKANGKSADTEKLKPELLNAAFELGPNTTKLIEKL